MSKAWTGFQSLLTDPFSREPLCSTHTAQLVPQKRSPWVKAGLEDWLRQILELLYVPLK